MRKFKSSYSIGLLCTTEVAVRFSRRCLRFDATLDGKLYAIGVPAILNLWTTVA